MLALKATAVGVADVSSPKTALFGCGPSLKGHISRQHKLNGSDNKVNNRQCARSGPVGRT